MLVCNIPRMPKCDRELARSFSKKILKRKKSLNRTTVVFPDVLRSFLMITLRGGSSINFSVTSVETIKGFSN